MSFKCATNCANRPRFFILLRVLGLLVACATFPSIFRYSIEKRSPCQSPTLFYFIKGFRLVGSLRYLPSIFRYLIEKRSPCQSPALFYLVARIKRVCCRFTLCSQSAKLSKKLYYVTSFVFRFAFLVSFI